MKSKKLTQRMDIGEAVIAAAQLTDTTAVADPLRAFVDSHAVFTEAQAAVAALPALEPLEAKLREARRRRDNLGDRRDASLRVLRHGARYADSAGAHGLHDARFGRARRKPKRKRTWKPSPGRTGFQPVNDGR